MNLLSLLKNHELIILDGAMGSQLASRGLSMSGQNNLTNPQDVLDIHKAYCESGSQVLITNTLTMNPVYIRTHGIDVDTREVNHSGVELARKAAGITHLVLGNMGSTGKLMEPYGDLAEADAFESFKEQAGYLIEEGVDGIFIETMIDLREALCALHACKEITSLPILVSMAFSSTDNGGRTIMGNSAIECAQRLTEAGAQGVGANCGDIDPLQMADIITTLRQNTNLPIIAQPNAGMPKLINNQTVFDMSPQEFSKGIHACIQAGATLVGGCCGTTPDHIWAINRSLV